jgi:prepilin-type N-terminal cleavage/methylation domain-containing protein
MVVLANRTIIKSKKGFTLFEMLIVMAVIAILAVLILTRYRSGEQQYKLSQAAQLLAADLRQAQNFAIAGVQNTGFSNIGGYGVQLSAANSYRIFLTDSGAQSCGSIGPTKQYIKDVSLPSKIIFIPGDVGKEVFFIPPYPKTCLNNNPSLTEQTFTFLQEGGSDTSSVYVNIYGIIEIRQ